MVVAVAKVASKVDVAGAAGVELPAAAARQPSLTLKFSYFPRKPETLAVNGGVLCISGVLPSIHVP